jgi:hypothetical protein
MDYILTRYNDETGEETSFLLEIGLGYDEDSYEDGYVAVRGGFYRDGPVCHKGKPFDLTEEEEAGIDSYISMNHRKLEREMEPEPDYPEPDDYLY